MYCVYIYILSMYMITVCHIAWALKASQKLSSRMGPTGVSLDFGSANLQVSPEQEPLEPLRPNDLQNYRQAP